MNLENFIDQLPFRMLIVNREGDLVYGNEEMKKFVESHYNKSISGKIQQVIPESKIIRVIKDNKSRLTSLEFNQLLFEYPSSDNQHGLIIMFPKNVIDNLVNNSFEVVSLKQELEFIMNLSGELVTITDGKGIVLRVNRTCQQIMGVNEKDFIGKDVKLLEGSGVINLSSTRKVMESKREVSVEQVTKSGRRLVVDGYPIFDNGGDLTKIINISKDVTEVDDLKRKLKVANTNLNFFRKELSKLQNKGKRIVSRSKEMEIVNVLVERVADVDATVFINGETGVGKEIIARQIYELSGRNENPFITINCSAIPENLMESEFFGYAGGTFTGGKEGGKKGLLAAADKGTLFLDEIGELTLNLQAKLLQVLQEKEFTPLGETKPQKVDVRFIAATNRDIEKMVRNGEFREDLFYRLYVVPITVPPLRERKEDIALLTTYFLEQYNEKYYTSKYLDKAVIQAFIDYEWKGNVRQLQNTVERIVLTTPNEKIELEHLPEDLVSSASYLHKENDKNLKEAVNEFEKTFIKRSIATSKTQREASVKLGIDISTISRKMKKHGLDLA